MANTRSARKKQTTLSFSPLPTSSPARESQAAAVRDRAAAVTFTDGDKPTKRRKTLRDYLPSPTASSQIDSFANEASSPSRLTRSFITGQNRQENSVKRANNPALTQLHSLGIFDGSESDTPNMFSSPTKRSRARKIEYVSEEEEDSASEESPTPSPTKTQARKKHRLRQNVQESDSDAAIQVNSNADSNEDADEDDDEPPSRPGRRNARQSSRVDKEVAGKRDKADIDEDLEFLGDIDVESPRAVRQVSEKKSAKQQALDALKKRRLQRNAQHSDQPTQDENGDHSSGEDSNDHSEASNSVAMSEDGDATAALQDSNDDDFIVEDDEDETVGAPVELPFEFSHWKSKKPKELFKYVVEWMVQKKINPAFAMDDPIYKLSFDRLDDSVRGLGGSKFTSSAWTPAFSKALRSRPVLESHELVVDHLMLRDRCDACNRSGHPATWQATFQGNAYNKDSLEEVSDDDSEHESDIGQRQNGETFYIGRFCMGNANVAHTLTHWRFHLNEWVIDYLQNIGEISSEMVVRRDKWSISKKRRDAERIVDTMESDGEIQRLYRDFRNQVSHAYFANDTSGLQASSP